LLGYKEKQVRHMTLRKLTKLYNHHKNYYDFTLKKISYKDLEEESIKSEEWIPE